MSQTESLSTLPLRPTSTDTLAAAIRDAAAARAQIHLTGSNASPRARVDPALPLQSISTLRLNKVLDHAISDMTISVHAGISLDALQRHLAWHNQWLPIDPPIIARQSGQSPIQRTLGGLIATNALGPLRFANAGANDWRLLLLGMTCIDAAGTLIKGGGRTMKNVAGYSLPRLMIGSAGTLGAIAEVTLRTFARPQDEQAVLFFCKSAGHAESLLTELLTAPLTPAYIQAIGAKTFAANPLQLPTPRSGIIIVAGFLDRPQSCAAQIDTARLLPAARAVESISQTAAQAGRLRLWMTTEPAILPNSGGVGFRIHALSSQVAALLAAIDAAGQESPVWIVSEAATGLLRGSLGCTNALATLQNLIATHAPDASLAITQGKPTTPPHNALFARIKNELDPHNLFGAIPGSEPTPGAPNF